MKFETITLTINELEAELNKAKSSLLSALESEEVLKDASTIARTYLISLKKKSWITNFYKWLGKDEEPMTYLVSKLIPPLSENET